MPCPSVKGIETVQASNSLPLGHRLSQTLRISAIAGLEGRLRRSVCRKRSATVADGPWARWQDQIPGDEPVELIARKSSGMCLSQSNQSQ